MAAKVALLAALVTITALAGCLGGEGPTKGASDDGIPPRVQDRHLQPFNVTGPFSQTFVAGIHDILDPLSVFIDVALPLDEIGAAATNDAKVHMGVWLPDVPAGTKVPVVADIGPYYEDGDVAADVPANRLGRFLIENLVPHGYAVAQVSVFGTGQSNHCMDLMGRAEQLGIDAAVTFLGTQDWSNGNVGLIGRSYDGSTPWQAAMFGNPALKTIVPISGLIGMHELMWRNGTAEGRGPVMHNQVYGFFGIDSVKVNAFAALGGNPQNAVTVGSPDTDDADTLCKDYMQGLAQGYAAVATGDHVAPQYNDYWAERYFLPAALENYRGSVYFIHGMQDWNVDPHMAFPTYQTLIDNGYEVKGLFGQWGHMYPDRPTEHIGLPEGRGAEASRDSPRFDWAQDLLEWFDHYLMGTGPKPQLHVEVQDNMGGWRIEPTYPPVPAEWRLLTLDTATKGHTGPDIVLGGNPASNAAGNRLEYTFAPLEEETRLAGTVRAHLTVTPTGPGGQIYARLEDDTGFRLGHGVMDLRYAAGDGTSRAVTPNAPLVAKMELFAMDVVVPAGTSLRLVLTPTGDDYRGPTVPDPVLIDTSSASVVKLPIVTPEPESFFTPVAWEPCTFPGFVDGSENLRSRVNDAYGCQL